MKLKPVYLMLLTLLACSGGNENTTLEIDISSIKLKELNDQPLDLSQFEGKTVFINFWATWCKPCIQEMPTIAGAQKKLKDENVIFLFASNEESDQIEKFAKKHHYNFHYVQLENLEALSIQALPTTFIFNQEGELKFSETGFRVWDNPTNLDLITKIIHKQ